MPIMSSTIPPAEPEVVPQEVPDSPEAQVPHNDQTSSPINTTGPIVADDFSDESSEFGSDGSDMTSLSSSVLEYEYENGRRYHSSRTVCFVVFLRMIVC
ncbi:uncharacterized protein N7529_003019 [Penicillium soppii]|uniref:uncharacterized protein n=1 Tax=Penicillium soppii TaxID=69789 RepID=UPI0025479BF1|nr:uncharacterized protein N7529_003019 [Penicillium soppii]KAJ5874589.1 hypothetical protein N7529_003019 [Penicillium soppii]